MPKITSLTQGVVAVALSLGILSAWAARGAIDGKLDQVASAADRTNTLALLQTMADRFGPRLTGSAGEHAAADWALQQMREFGLDHVHAESWTLNRGWERQHATAHLVKPYNLDLAVASYGWSGSTGWTGSTRAAVAGDVVLVDSNAPPAASIDSTGWAGNILLLTANPADSIRPATDAADIAKIAQQAHALAIIDGIDRSGNFLLHTAPLGFPAQERLIPVLDMPREQRQLLVRLIQRGVKPRLELDVATRFSDEPIHEENIVSEIQGAVHPDEVILIGAHLDSWDLSAGATDDGVGVAAVLGAAHAIRLSGIRPDRTIRFVLFTGEEQGLLGSRAFVKQHKPEWSNLVCALVLDWGAGPIIKVPLAGHPEMKQSFDQLFAGGRGLQNLTTASGSLRSQMLFLSPWLVFRALLHSRIHPTITRRRTPRRIPWKRSTPRLCSSTRK